jgi:hypothetical protein
MTLRLKVIGSLSAAVVLCGASQVCASTYNVSDIAGSLSVNGTITTDGDTGPLVSSDIQSWSLTITGFGGPVVLSNSNSAVSIGGDGLTATSAGLFFNFNDSSGAYLEFVVPSSSYVQWVTAHIVTPNAGLNLDVGNNSGAAGTFLDQSSTRSGTGEIAEIPDITSTPLPGTLPLFAIGLGVLSWLGWRNKRKSFSVAA